MATNPVATPSPEICKGIGVVRSRSADRRQLIGNRIRVAQLDQALGDFGIDVWTAKDDRPVANCDVTLLMFVDRWAVGRVGNIDRDCDRWIDAAGGGLCAPQSNLFLHRRNAVQVTSKL